MKHRPKRARWRLGPVVMAACACAPSPAPSESPSTASPHATHTDGTRPRRETTGAGAASGPPVAPAAATSVAPPAGSFDALVFERLLDAPIRSIALGQPPKVAVLADAPYVFDGTRFVRYEIPTSLRGDTGHTDHVEIFFGRDNQPRLMGARIAPDGGASAVYLRYRTSGWRPEPSELGPLASVSGGLYGLLGYADPEVVCAPGIACLVKRVTGWARVDADSTPTSMFLTARGVYKASGQRLLRLDGATWRVAAEPFALEPESLCHRTEAELWLIAEGALYVRRGDSARFEETPSPLTAPRAVHCAAEASVWVVGDDGAAHHDGADWSVVPGELGGLRHVTGRGPEEIWLAGDQGVFVGRALRAPGSGPGPR